jgi:transcriptional regulator with XRE-family HTH domain
VKKIAIFVGKNQHKVVKIHFMTANTNTDILSMSNLAIAQCIGLFIKQRRLQLNKTQAQLATEAGLNRYTISQIENGEGATLSTLIQLLRALDALYVLESFKVEEVISPILYAKMQKKKRLKASGKNSADTSNNDLGW